MRFRNVGAIALDMDGTIFNGSRILVSCYNAGIDIIRKKYLIEINTPSVQAILRETGKPVNEIMYNLFPELSSEILAELQDQVGEMFDQKIREGAGELYNGVKSTLEYLLEKQYLLWIASNGRKDYINAIIDHFFLRKYFPSLHTISPSIPDKTQLLSYYISSTKIDPKQVVMIGDRLTDYNAAITNQTQFLWAGYGFEQTGERPLNVSVITSFSDIQSYV